MECSKEKNASRCNCTYEPCPRKGACCECLSHHLAQKELPGCCFPDDAEKTWNRSFAHFADLVNQGKI